MSTPWEDAKAAAQPKSETMPWEDAKAALEPSPSDWQARVKPIDLGNGKASVQRDDGGVWFGPEQGNKGKAGWFDAQGNRLGDAPGKGASVADRMINAGEAQRQGVMNNPGATLLRTVGGQSFIGLPGVQTVAGV